MKRILLIALLLCSLADAKSVRLGVVCSAKIATGACGTAGPASPGEKAFQATVTGTGAVSATVKIQVSNDPTNEGWVDMATVTLSGTTTSTDGFASEASWAYYRGNVTAISGTGATVTVSVAQE